jgi:tetratricopeptide (TPR) repeat protein
MIAHALDPTHPMALNLLANHHFHSWKTVEFGPGSRDCYLVGRRHILAPASLGFELLAPRNQLRINRDISNCTGGVYTVTAMASAASFASVVGGGGPDGALADILVGLIDNSSSSNGQHQQQDRAARWEEFILVEVTPQLSSNLFLGDAAAATVSVFCLEVKDLLRVESLARQAISFTTQLAVTAESNYILGKVAHSLGETDNAARNYYIAVRDEPNMTIAAFGFAQILFYRKEYSNSLELFERVLSQSPDDKDTQAYVMLLKSMLKKEVAQFEKLKDIAPGFIYESELWLIQGHLRQHSPAEHKQTLKCFLNAKACIEDKLVPTENGGVAKMRVGAAVLSNIAVLQHSLGSLEKALEYMKLALKEVHIEATTAAATASAAPSELDELLGTTTFRSSELEDIFYCWSARPVCSVRQVEAGAFRVQGGASSDSSSSSDSSAADVDVDLGSLLAVGAEVVIGGIKHVVERITGPRDMVCSSPVKLRGLSYAAGEAQAPCFDVRVKENFNNFNDSTITYCYNLARLLEDLGHTRAASEIFVELLKRHPSFIECKCSILSVCCSILFFAFVLWLDNILQ